MLERLSNASMNRLVPPPHPLNDSSFRNVVFVVKPGEPHFHGTRHVEQVVERHPFSVFGNHGHSRFWNTGATEG